jgi:hypothetical protein
MWKSGNITFNYDKSGFKKGNNHPDWKGGKHKDSKGYNIILAPENPFSANDGYILEHRLIWFSIHPETPKDWIIHHLNGIRDDNRIENLFACSRRRHIKEFPNTYIKALQNSIRELEGELIRQ